MSPCGEILRCWYLHLNLLFSWKIAVHQSFGMAFIPFLLLLFFWFWHRQAWAAVHLRECICIFATVIKLQLPFVATAAVPAVGHESGACLKVGNAFFAASSWLPIAVSPSLSLSLCVRRRGLPVSLCGCECECMGVCASACVYLYICIHMQQGRLAKLQF